MQNAGRKDDLAARDALCRRHGVEVLGRSPPFESRKVTPMALTLVYENGKSQITPSPIEYATRNDPKRNAFFREAAG